MAGGRKPDTKSPALRIDVRSRIDFHLFGWSELLGTGEGWGPNESRLSLLGTAFCFRVEDFSDAVIDDFNNQRAARIRFEHDVGRLDVAMHNVALFRAGHSALGLLNHFKLQR